MEKLTPKQEEYLLLFAVRDGHDKCISEAAKQFCVSKPTAIRVSSALEEQGMINRGARGEISLTEKGRGHVAEKLENMFALADMMSTRLGIVPASAEREARRMVVSLEEETVNAILRYWKSNDRTKEDDATGFMLSEIPAGTYRVDFQVRKKDSGELSMGDNGFMKPAFFFKEDGAGTFVLYPQQIDYRPHKKKLLNGILERLWYYYDDAWYEAKRSEDGACLLPGAFMHCGRNGDGLTAKIRIRARASVGMLGMPESEADLVFFLDGAEKDEAAAAALPR